ncbi:hypothetical protein Nepgr_007656 [Nepenthes gracilis]|uniref:Uncharacterized protein n=1 Tax=Nepenthes gracilis TaxID=150966 RepID=A0AAD3S7M9_NEPGR|nr:hypothetical protein Nepgr_007656 [Nepenthes gracilis]
MGAPSRNSRLHVLHSGDAEPSLDSHISTRHSLSIWIAVGGEPFISEIRSTPSSICPIKSPHSPTEGLGSVPVASPSVGSILGEGRKFAGGEHRAKVLVPKSKPFAPSR